MLSQARKLFTFRLQRVWTEFTSTANASAFMCQEAESCRTDLLMSTSRRMPITTTFSEKSPPVRELARRSGRQSLIGTLWRPQRTTSRTPRFWCTLLRTDPHHLVGHIGVPERVLPLQSNSLPQCPGKFTPDSDCVRIPPHCNCDAGGRNATGESNQELSEARS